MNSSCGSVKVTEDHSIISLINNKIAYAKPNEASHIASPSYYPSTNQSLIISLKKEKLLANRQNSRKRRLPEYIKLDKKLMTFFGLWLADGCYQKNKGREGIHVSSYKDRECAKIIDYVFKLFDAKNTITDKGITAQTSSKTMYNIMN